MGDSKYNIYRIDDIFIKIGYVCLVLFILIAGSAVSNMIKGRDPDYNSLYAATGMFFAPSVVFLFIGYHFRYKEQIAAAIMKKLEVAREAPLTDLVASTGFSSEAIEQALLLINRRSHCYYVSDKTSGRIFDGRLQRSMIMVESCKSCGSTIGAAFPAYASEMPRCPYCSNPLDATQWNELKRNAIDDLNKQEIHASIAVPVGSQGIRQGPVFSMPVFVVLLLAFWPAAIVYAVSRYNKS